MRFYPLNNAFFVVITVLLHSCSQHEITPAPPLTADRTVALPASLSQTTQQIILVTTDTWSTNTGTLSRFSWQDNRWQQIEPSFPIMLGRNGLAWGQGLHNNPVGEVQKKEGDDKAPAGIFPLGTAFGYASKPLNGMKIPYRAISTRDYYVDDVSSDVYNQWQHINKLEANTPKQHWRSFEKMRRDDLLYEYGMVIEHNSQPVIKHKGSAVFFHVWKAANMATSGCTSMSKQHMQQLLQWVDAKRNPLLIQLPIAELKTLSNLTAPVVPTAQPVFP